MTEKLYCVSTPRGHYFSAGHDVMTPAIIISRYADLDINNRRRNVREGVALARWAAANGYCPIGWWDDLDTVDPPCDSDPAVRQAALERSAMRARLVGAAGGVAIVPDWYPETAGMKADYREYFMAGSLLKPGGNVSVTFAQIEPYLPRDLVGQVQAAVDEAAGDPSTQCRCLLEGCGDCDFDAGANDAVSRIADHTGVTSTEATAPRPMVIGQSCQILQDTDGIWRCVLSDGHWFGGDATRSKAADRARINGYEVTP